MTKKAKDTDKPKTILAGDYAGVGIFEVQFEVNEKATDRYERFRLIGVRLLARAKI